MLVLKIKPEHTVKIGDAVLKNVGTATMKIGIEAGKSIPIVRDDAKELAEAK